MVLNGVAATSRGSACWYVQDRHGEPGTNDLADAQETRFRENGVWQSCSGSRRLPRLVATATRSRRKSTRGTAHWPGVVVRRRVQPLLPRDRSHIRSCFALGRRSTEAWKVWFGCPGNLSACLPRGGSWKCSV